MIYIKYTHKVNSSDVQISDYADLAARETNEANFPQLVSDYDAEDVTVVETQKKINRDSREYLRLTDWYALRLAETAVAIPADILAARASARAAIVD